MPAYNNATSNASSLVFIYCHKIPWTVAFTVQFISSVVGNVLILLIVYKDSRLKTTTNYLIANMAASDLLMTMFAFPRTLTSIFDQWLVGGHLGNILCKLSLFVFNASLIISVFSCVFIGVDRYYAVARPMLKPLEGKVKHIVTLIWITSGALCLPYWYFYRLVEHHCMVVQYTSYLIYELVLITSTLVLPVLPLTLMYTITVFRLYRHQIPGETRDIARTRRNQQNRKVFKMSLTILGLMYLSLGANFIFFVTHYSGILRHVTQPQYMDTIIRLISYYSWSRFITSTFIYCLIPFIVRTYEG